MIGIFGASGFIGKHLTRHLAQDGRSFTAVARVFDEELYSLGGRFVQGDLRNGASMASALEGVDTVVQLMATSTPAQGNSRTTEHIENDVVPHVEFLNLCVEQGVRRFIFASSGGTVYGPVSALEPTPESWPTSPISSHGVTKLMVEHFIRLHGHLDGLEYVTLRIANPYGPGQVFKRGQGLIPALMQRYNAGEPVTIFGDGSMARDYLYVDDLIRAITAAAFIEGSPALVLNVGSGVRRTVLDVVRSIEEVLGITFKIDYQPTRDADVPTIALDVERIRRELDWKPEVDFHEGLRRTLLPTVR